MDHVPPKALFPKPLPADMVTAPSCEVCHSSSMKDDATVRNILVSTREAEQHPTVLAELADRRDRSLTRSADRSGADVRELLDIMQEVEVVTNSGIYAGKAVALNFDNAVLDRFVHRLSRALLWYAFQQEHFRGRFEWRMNVDLPPTAYEGVMRYGKIRRVGEVFAYGVTPLGASSPSWLFADFFGCTEFMIRTENAEQDGAGQPATRSESK